MGGSRSAENIQKLCQPCHDVKSNIEQAAMKECPYGLFKEVTLLNTKQSVNIREQLAASLA